MHVTEHPVNISRLNHKGVLESTLGMIFLLCIHCAISMREVHPLPAACHFGGPKSLETYMYLLGRRQYGKGLFEVNIPKKDRLKSRPRTT